VASRLGLQGKSFDLAAEAYEDAVGGSMSADSLRRVTMGTGQAMDAYRDEEVEQVYTLPEPKRFAQAEVRTIEPLEAQANISTDGGMVLIRDEGWKEAKLATISEVEVKAAQESKPSPDPSSRRAQDPCVRLHRHSYQVGLWDAAEMGQHQFVEGLRRGLERCEPLSSVNDGARWIARITDMNFPQAVQIVDWRHAETRIWNVANTIFGERTPEAKQWTEVRLDHLWEGDGHIVVKALQQLNLEHKDVPDEVRQTPEYFNSRQPKMDYARFRQNGFPIGSGTVESGINTVVHHRMKRPGRGWRRKHAQAMLAGLSELHSGRFNLAWQSITSAPS
jgi:hypothetical protein